LRILNQKILKIKSSTFDEANVSALNEPQSIDLTMKTDNRKTKGRKRKGSAPSERKRNKTYLLRNIGHTRTQTHTHRQTNTELLKEIEKYQNGR
jgi:hypothetical protein